MPYQDTVFGGLMKAFPRWRFEKLLTLTVESRK